MEDGQIDQDLQQNKFDHNQETLEFFEYSKIESKMHPETYSYADPAREQRKLVEEGQLYIVHKFMRFYDDLIRDIIDKRNQVIYAHMVKFLSSENCPVREQASLSEQDGPIPTLGASQTSQIPTSLVITSSESHSSIDTQFQSIIERLIERDVIALDLDEKKCGTLKKAIEHILRKFDDYMQINLPDDGAGDDLQIEKRKQAANNKEKFEPLNICIMDGQSSSSSEDYSDDEKQQRAKSEDHQMKDIDVESPHEIKDVEMRDMSSNFISSLVEPSLRLCEDSSMGGDPADHLSQQPFFKGQTEDLLHQFQKIMLTQEQITGPQDQPHQSQDPVDGVPQKQKQRKSQATPGVSTRVTRRQMGGGALSWQAVQVNVGDSNGRKAGTQQQLAPENVQSTAILDKETFRGLERRLLSMQLKQKPVLLVIKNIKVFNSGVLNELIHLLRVYREPSTYACNFCLMLGVQNNNRDQVHLKISVQNCAKLSLQEFIIPSMKNIIFEAFNKMLLTCTSPSNFVIPLTFSTRVVRELTETINMYGISVNKFKRFLRMVLVDNLFANPFYFVHQVCLDQGTHSFKDHDFDERALEANKPRIVKAFEGGLKISLPQQTQEDRSKYSEVLFKEMFQYAKAKRQWMKAFEVFQQVCMETQDFQGDLDKDIFNLQLVLNYLNKKDHQDRSTFVMGLFSKIANAKEMIVKRLLPILKISQDDEEHSKFLQFEIKKLEEILESRKCKPILNSNSTIKKSRTHQLLQGGRPAAAGGVFNEETGMVLEEKDHSDYIQELKLWIRQYANQHLNAMDEKNMTTFQQQCFYLQWEDARPRLSPDIEGYTLKSIHNVQEKIGYQLEQSLAPQPTAGSEFTGLTLNSNHEDTKTLLDILKYFGRDVNIYELFQVYKKSYLIHESQGQGKSDQNVYSAPNDAIAKNFLRALVQMKYQGLLSATKTNMFLFKKNFYGKPFQSGVYQSQR